MPEAAKINRETSLVGLQIGDSYRLVRLLGKGGMGHVYEAEHLRLPRRAAVKVVRRELASNPELFERFKREAEVTSAIGNPHIVQVLDFNTLPDGSPYMVMELLKGEDLSQRLARGPLSLPEAQDILGQAADGLSAAHAQGVVHRDVKPANVFLSIQANGRVVVKLLDFGVSKIRGSGLTGVHAMGTAWYMSPEQIRAAASVDARADLYSLAVVLFECLAGRPPFDAETAFAAMEQVVHTPAPSILRWLPIASPELDAAIQRGMAKEPGRRPATVMDFWREVEPAITASARTGDDRTVKRPSLPDVSEPRDTSPPLDTSGISRSQLEALATSVQPSVEAYGIEGDGETRPVRVDAEAAVAPSTGMGLTVAVIAGLLAIAVAGLVWSLLGKATAPAPSETPKPAEIQTEPPSRPAAPPASAAATAEPPASLPAPLAPAPPPAAPPAPPAAAQAAALAPPEVAPPPPPVRKATPRPHKPKEDPLMAKDL